MKKQHFLRFLSMLMALCLVGSLCTPFAQVRATETEAPATKVYDFESDTAGAAPAGISTLVELDKDTLTVADDPKGENGKVMELNHISGQTALTAVVPFAPQTGSMTLQFKVMFGPNAAQYGIYLLDGIENTNMGPYLLATATGMLQYFNGNTKVDLQEYKADTWYTVKFVADASQKTYDVYIDGEQKVTGAAFRKGTFADLDYLFIACQGKYNSKLYIDSIEVPGGDVEVETDKTAPVWAENALSASNVKATSADLSFTPAVDAEGSAKFEVVVGENTAATVDFTDTEELSFALEGATVNDTEKGQGDVYIIKPKNIPEGVKLPVLIGLHGNNGTASVFQTHTGIYGKIKEVALQNGYIFAAISNGADIWGQNNDAGVDNVKKLLDYLVKTYNTQDKAALWAYSAGGVLANRMVMEYPDSVSFVVGTYPVYDVADMYANFAACTAAWGENAADAIAAINPAANTAALANHKFYLTHGDADTTVPLATHSQAMKNALGDKVKLEVVSGGTHDSKNWAFHNETVLSAFSENPAAIQVTLSGLSAETAYSVTVKAADAAGNTASSNAAAFTTTAAEGGGEEPPEEDTVKLPYDFEGETVGSLPSYVVAENVVEGANTVTVAADPADAENQILFLNDVPASANALKANVSIGAQTGKVDISFRIKAGDTTNDYIINLLGTKGEELKQGTRFLLRAGNLQKHNGSAFEVIEAYDKDTWYTVKFAMDIENNKYDLYLGDKSIATDVSFANSGLADINTIQFTTSGKYAGETLYIDDIAVTTPGTFGEGGGEEPVDPPVTPEDPEVPDVAFDFQEDILGAAPKYITATRTDETATVKVVVDPTDANNKVMLLENPADGPAPHALVNFAEQTGKFTVAYRVMFGSDAQYGVLLQSGTDTDKQGAYLVSRDSNNKTNPSKVQNINGSAWNTLFDAVTLNQWYSVQIDADVTAKTYDISVTDANGVTKTATGTFRHASNITSLNYMSFETQGAYAGKLYVDDIAVPDPIKVEPVAPSFEKYVPAYFEEQLLADGDKSTYLSFPTILKLSDEKVLIAYKAGTSHANDESSVDMIVYNPTTKEVVSKTTVDGTVGENAQNPELMQMPNGDLVIYLDVQRITGSGQQRYGIKEIRSTDGGATWKVLAADGTYKAVEEVEKHGYKKLQDDTGIVYGYTFDDVTVDGTVYMLAMSFPEFDTDTVAPGRSVHIIKSSDNGATWTHVKNLTTTFGIAFNESTLEACEGGFIVNCRKDSDGKKGVSYRTDMDFNVLVEEDYSDYSDILKTTHRPKMFIEDGKYYLLGRNILTGTTTLGLYEIDPVTLVPLNYIELNDLPGHSTANSFYAEYYLQDDENGNTYFNVITYDDALNKGHPDIVRYEYVWEELLTQTPVTPVWASDAVSVENVMQTTADVVFKAPSDNEFVTDYTITLNGETAGTIDFEEIKEVTGTLEGAKGKSDGSYYIAMPKNIPAGMKLPVVIAVHGSGRGALDYRDTPFYAEQKNIALANGYIFAAISNGSDTWGLDTGLENLNAFYDFLIANYPVQEKAALWATSAGGTLTNRMVKDHPEKVSFVLGTFPVYDLIAGFNVNSCKTAWGTTDLEAFKTLIDGKNPAQFPEALKNHDYYIAQGDADTAVPLADHSQKMVADVGSNVHLQVIEGGVHGTSDYSFYGDIIEQAFDEHPAVYTYALSGLTAATDYTVAITAADADGFTAVSNAVSFKTLAEGQTPGEPDEPEVPEEPTYVTYDFEGEAPLDAFKLVDTTENSPITVAEDPSNAENHVMKIVKAEQDVDGTANKANVAFEKQEGTFTASFKVRIGANSRFVINLYSGENLGPRILLEPDGRVRIKNGGSWVNKSTYTADTWYTFEFEANAETDTYNVRVNDQLIAEGMAFEKSAESLDSLTFATFGAYSAEVYVDDVTVPEPPVPLYYTPEYMVSEVLFDGEDDLANTLGKYTPFPTILKISEEKVVIVYKRGVSHMDCEADMEAIVYNPTTEQVVSRTMLDATVGEAAQNPEIMQMPNGDLMIYLDVQRIQSGGRQRFGVKQFRSTDEGETWKVLAADGTYKNVEEVEKHGFRILEDDTGIQYGYTFDDVVVGNDVYMLAMSFAEFNNDKAAPGRSTHIIKSSDNGATWTHIKNLNEEFNFAFNESTLEACGDGYMIVARGDSGAIPKTFLVDKDFNLVKEQDYAEHTDTVTALGRPKLFVEDGKYYLLTRNRTGTFIMALYELDPETLEIVNYISLDQFTGDSCYAESFFHEKHGQKFLNVINYGDRSGDGKPDIVRTEYIWEELVTKQPVEVKAHTYDCEAEKAEYLKSEGDCETDAVYYKSCSCGVYTEDETFTVKTSGHDWSKADGVCGTCGAVCDHAADNGKDHVCDVCGKELSKCVDADKNGKCDICGADVKVEEEPKPSDPTDPSEPEDEKPADPTDPTDPSKPEDEKPEDKPTEPTTPSEPEKIENPFEDITEDMFCYDAVLWAYHNKITTGKTETTFEPSMDCTRAQVVTFLWRAAGEPEPKDAKNPFPDVADGKYYTKAVLWAVEEGITNGFKDGSFGPNKTCTRGQIVTFLWRYADEPDVKDTENPFPDLDVKSYCGDAVLWAVENGITTGYKNGTFGPDKNCTRDQIVTFLYRYMVE